MREKARVKALGSLVFVILALLFLTSSSLSQTKKQITIEKLQDIENPEAEFSVELWVDREDGTYKVGEKIIFFFKANRDCRLTLFNVATNGQVLIIFPN